jgi:hypothetical protein
MYHKYLFSGPPGEESVEEAVEAASPEPLSFATVTALSTQQLGQFTCH